MTTEYLPMDVDARLAALEELCLRRDWQFNHWRGSQREPGEGVSVRFGQGMQAPMIRCESRDGMEVALARMELALAAIASAGKTDAYFLEPHARMGRL